MRLLGLLGLVLVAAPASALSPYYVFFDSGSARLTQPAQTILDNAAAAIRMMDVSEVRVHASADRQGSAAYNQALSQRRAEAVKAALVSRGLSARSIAIVAHGENAPLIETPDGVAEPQNRYAYVLLHSFCRDIWDANATRAPGCPRAADPG